jgi:hypothetical protein
MGHTSCAFFVSCKRSIDPYPLSLLRIMVRMCVYKKAHKVFMIRRMRIEELDE